MSPPPAISRRRQSSTASPATPTTTRRPRSSACASVNALLRAAEANCRSVAFPLLATGHARLRFDQSPRVIVQELREATLDHAWIVINDPDQLEETTRAVGEVFPGEVEVEMSAPQDERSSWFGEE